MAALVLHQSGGPAVEGGPCLEVEDDQVPAGRAAGNADPVGPRPGEPAVQLGRRGAAVRIVPPARDRRGLGAVELDRDQAEPRCRVAGCPAEELVVATGKGRWGLVAGPAIRPRQLGSIGKGWVW